jgi:hypothetical protein
MEDISALLNVTTEDVTGLLEELNPSDCSNTEKISITFHYMRFQNNRPRERHLVSKLCDLIVSYCLNRDKYQDARVADYRRLYLRAKEKFAHPKDSKTGEPGELITFFLLEGYLHVPKIFSKMSLKTNPQMHFHGSDGVHLGVDSSFLTLYFGESKVYQSRSSAIADALKSVTEFVGTPNSLTNQTQEEFEINVLSDNLDIPEGDLRERVLDALDPYDQTRSELQYTYACFIGFDLDQLSDPCEKDEFVSIYEDEAKRCYNSVKSRIEQDPILKDLTWHFFFIPFASVEDFRENFLEELEK